MTVANNFVMGQLNIAYCPFNTEPTKTELKEDIMQTLYK